jgi:SAM-dependent methyltransferase
MIRSAFGQPYWLIDRLFREQLTLVSDYIRGDLSDAGCGDMPFREILQPLVRSYVGVDGRQREGIVVGELRNLPFDCESFDTVVCFEVLDDFPEPRELLCELRRVLRKSGANTVCKSALASPRRAGRLLSLHSLWAAIPFECTELSSNNRQSTRGAMVLYCQQIGFSVV